MSQITVPSTSKPQKSININFGVDLIINGVTNMVESDEKQIICNLGDKSLIITGEKLIITSLDTEKCVCAITGSVESLKYVKGKQKQSLLKRFFK